MSKEKHLAVVLSDWHIHSYKNFNNGSSRLDNCLRVLEDVGKFCHSKEIKTILFVGDLYDTHQAIFTEVVNRTIEAFLDFAKNYPDITIYAISGNHDQGTKNILGKEAVTALSHIESVIPNNFVLIDNKSVGIGDGIAIHGVPYYEYKEHFRVKLEERSVVAETMFDTKNILLIHQTPAGLDNEMIPADTNPADELYKPFDYTFCGHIHLHKRITENFCLVGNPIHRDAADTGKDKGFLVMNLVKPEKGFIFIKLIGYPEFISAFDDEEVEDAENNYVVRKPRLDTLKLQENAKVEEFNTDLSPDELMTNFWKEADGKDEDLLSVGLGFLSSTELS